MVRWPNLTAVLQLLALHKSVIGDDVVRWPVRLALHTEQFRGVEGNALQGTVAAGFIVDVAVGTPPQQLTLFVDTGSSDVAIASYPERNLTTYFDTNKSATYKSNGEHVSKRFVEGSYGGTVGSDVLQDRAGDLALRVALVAISSSADMFPNQSHWQGLLGLAFPALSKQTSFMQVLDTQKGIKHFELSPCTREKTSTFDKIGVLEFGGRVSEATAYTAVVRETYFEIALLDIRVGHHVWPGSCTEGIYNLSQDAGTVYCLEDGFVTAGFPDVHLHFPDSNGKVFELELTPEVYFQRVKVTTGDRACYKLGIGASELGTVIGFNVLRKLHTVFDLENKRVGFSKLHCAKGGVGVVYTNYSYTGHSCAWDFVTMEDNAWTILLYVLIFIVVMCAIPSTVILFIWIRKKVRIYRARTTTEGVGLVDF
uniref:Putative aspartyl protease n=1 Tax=Ixodes scapularis TaxID=6945 RepID=A0A4D5RQ34_IXOSC